MTSNLLKCLFECLWNWSIFVILKFSTLWESFSVPKCLSLFVLYNVAHKQKSIHDDPRPARVFVVCWRSRLSARTEGEIVCIICFYHIYLGSCEFRSALIIRGCSNNPIACVYHWKKIFIGSSKHTVQVCLKCATH